MLPQKQAYIYAALAVLFWSTVASAFKIGLDKLEMGVAEVLAYASFSSTFALLLVAAVQGKIGVVLRQNRAEWLRSAVLGLLNPFLYYLILFKAYALLPAQEAQPLNFTWPIVLSLLSVPLLKQKLGLRAFLGLLISFAGVVVISTRGDLTSLRFSEPLGTGLAIGSSVIWALFWIMSLRDERYPIVKLLSAFMFGSVYVTPILLCARPSCPSLAFLLCGAYIGFFEMGFTFVLWLKALSLSQRSAAVSNLAYLAPFISLIFIHLVVGEHIRASSVMGLALIVSGILVQAVRQKPATG